MLEWVGRQLNLIGYSDGTVTNFIYNADGIRTEKWYYDAGGGRTGTVKYTLDGNKIVAENRLGVNIYYTYDDKGAIMGMIYGGQYYLFSKNLQGDVIGIYNDNRQLVAKYEYNAFGEITAITNASGTDVSTNASHIANINPFRYRGYYYDTETGFYYLQSRYYDPVVGRFINADNQLQTEDIIGLNLFAYCGNNPVNRFDPTGEAWWHWALGAAVVAVCAVATVVTCGGFAAAAVAVASVGSGVAAATTAATVAAGAFIGSATAFGVAVATAASTSSSVQEFNDKGNWGTVADTAISGALGAVGGLALDKSYSSKSTPTKSVPNPNGKKGCEAHQAEIKRQVELNRNLGFKVETEVKIETPGGAKPYRFADFSVTNTATNETWYGNVGLQLKSGAPCARERQAIADITGAGKTIKFYPYN